MNEPYCSYKNDSYFQGKNKKHDEHSHDFGNFTFDAEDSNSQNIYLGSSSSEKYQYIQIKVTENHGHQDRTCIYRIQVHGYNNEC